MIPVYLEMSNFQCFTKASLSFDFNSALIVGERDNNSEISNGAGKTTIFRAITWALFGKSKQKNANGVVKRGTDVCEVNFLFEHRDKRYRVVRKRNVRFSKLEVLLFEVLSNDTERPVPSDTNKETDAKIKEILKSNYEVFINSSYFMQNTISDFLNGTPAEKQKIVSSILNLERWNDYMKVTKSDLDGHTKLAGKIEFKVKDFDKVEDDLHKVEEELDHLETQSRYVVSEESNITKQIIDLEALVSNLKLQETTLNDYADTLSKIDNVNDRLKELGRSLKEKTAEIEHLHQRIASNDKVIEGLDLKIVEISSQIDFKNQVDLDGLEKELANKASQLNLCSRHVAQWEQEGAQKICDCCGERWDKHEDKVSEYKNSLSICEELEDIVTALNFKVKAAKGIVDKIKQTEIEIEKFTGRKKSIQHNNEINNIKKDIAEKELASSTDNLKEVKEKEEGLLSRLKGLSETKSSNSYEKVRNLLKSKKEEQKDINMRKNNLSYLIGGLTQRVKELHNNKKSKDDLTQQLNECRKNVVIYTSIMRSFSRNGIQAIIIDNVIEELTKVANLWLNDFSYEPTYVQFVTQKQDSKGGWKETLDIEVITPSGVCEFESLSGGEAFRVAFAIRLALSQIQSRRMGGESQLLLLDEVSTSLDQYGLEMFVSIIRKLEKTIKVLVVTHDDKLKDEFDNIIYVKKSNQDSELIY
jgi:exonuclease SbcC